MNRKQKIIAKEVMHAVMRSLLLASRNAFLAFVAFLLVIYIMIFASWRFVGKAVAKWDVAHGHYVVHYNSVGRPWIEDYATKLREQYGIDAQKGSWGCCQLNSTSTFRTGYALTQRAALIKRFGRDVVDESFYEARAAWIAKNSQP